MDDSYRRRDLEGPWLSASRELPVLLLTGPRQVGKTTLLRHVKGRDRRYVSLDDPAVRALAKEDPRLFLQHYPAPLLIDEIQYAPELLPYLKLAVDAERRPGAYWLTGSQQFHLMRGVSETLAGRVGIVTLLGLSAREADGRLDDGAPFVPVPDRIEAGATTGAGSDVRSIYRRVFAGGFPALVTGQVRDRELFFSSYVQTYLQRDLRDLARVGDEAAFLRFVRACAARTGQLLNLSDLARDVDISVPTAHAWLSLLETTWQVWLLRPYHSNVTKRLLKTPKLYFVDTGLAAWLTRWSSAKTVAAGAMSGALLETWAVIEVMKSWWHRMREPHAWFYRDRDGREIDLVLELDGKLHPIEVKRAATPRREWAAAFRALDRLDVERGHGAVLCLADEPIPLDELTTAMPLGAL